MSNSRNRGSRNSSRWTSWFQKRTQLKRELRRPAVESLEDRRLMAAVPYSDGLYYPPIGKHTGMFALQSQGVDGAEYARRSNLTFGGGSQGHGSSQEGLGPLVSTTAIEIEPNNVIRTAQVLPLGTVPGTSQVITVAGGMAAIPNQFDEDYYAVDLRAGDIFDAQIDSAIGVYDLSLNDAAGNALIATQIPTVGYYPPSSPLSFGGVASLAYVVPSSGRYYVRISDGTGGYSLRMQALRNTYENEAVGTRQILFIDFDGATFRRDIFDPTIPGTARVESLADSVARFGLTAADINPLIDRIIALVKEDFIGSLPSLAQNGYYSATGIPGQFDLDIRNSRDHSDPWGLPNVSRVIVGGDAISSGIGGVLGIAQSVDVGNFAREETALVLPGEFVGYDLIPRSPTTSYVEVLARAISNTISHETGHYFGGIHTEQDNLVFNIMDSGVTTDLFSYNQTVLGYGLDGIVGNADDIDVDFGTDRLEDLEFPLFSRVDNAAVIAFGLSTGTRGGAVTGRLFNDRNRDGNLGSGEEGLAGQLVFADYNNNGALDTSEPRVVSVSDGAYRLVVSPGTWTIRATAQTNWQLTGATSRTITVGLDQTVSNINFGQFLPNQTVTGFKWADRNGNGLRDTGEPGIGGVWIYVDLDGDDRIDIGEPAAKTNSDGSYSLTPPTSGTYAIREVVSPGFVQTFPASGEHIVTFNALSQLRGLDFGNLPARDYGDAPSPFPTLASSNGPSHGFDINLRLGANFDFEGDGLPNSTATGDDLAGQDDEDGVRFVRPIVSGDTRNSARIQVTNATGSRAFVSGWIDFNQDGDWNDAGEKILSDVEVTSSGTRDYTFSAPAGALLGTTYARFRLTAAAGLGFAGPADSGEVEDYQVSVTNAEKYAVNDAYTVSRNSVNNILDVQANDFMRTVPGESATITGVTRGTAGGLVSISSDGQSVIFTPRTGFIGIETFTYTVLTSTGRTDTATVTVESLFRVDDPIAVDDSYDIAQGSNSVAVPLNVLANDIEGVSGALTIESFTQPDQGGQLELGQGDLSLRYTPNATFTGTETFRYTARDSAGKRTSANVTIHLVEGSRLDDTVELGISFTNMSGGTITSVAQGDRFQVHINVDDLRNFPSEPGVYAAYLDLLYNSGLVGTVPATTSNGFNFDVRFSPPYTVTPLGSDGTPGLISSLGAYIGNVSTLNLPDPVRVVSITFEARSAGIAEFITDPANGAPDTDILLFDTPGAPVPTSQIRYRRAAIEILPNGVEFPFAVDDSLPTPLALNSNSNVIDVLQNDRVGSSGPIRIASVAPPSKGQAFIDDRGTSSTTDDVIRYTPNGNFSGTDQFSYTIRDTRGIESTAFVTLQVGNAAADDVVQLRLEATNLSGQPIDQIGVGQRFQLRGYVQQLGQFNSGDLDGVFAAFQDILYNSNLVSISTLNYESVFGNRGVDGNGDPLPPVPGRDYPNAPSGSSAIPGLINELGSVSKESVGSANIPGSSEKLQFIVEVTALAPGTVTFVGDPADLSPFHDTLVFDPTDIVPPSLIRYGTESITIGTTIIAGEGFTNMNNRFDVNNDGFTSPIDALIVINSLRTGSRELPRLSGAEGEAAPTMFVDVNGDGFLSPTDVLQVINAINRKAPLGEGEASETGATAALLDYDMDGAIDLLANDIASYRRRR